MLNYITSGESHGPQLTAIVSGFPAGVAVLAADINRELARRQQGYGRGERMTIEQDKVEILSGVRFGKTIGSPVTLVIKNRDWENWREAMSPDPGEPADTKAVTRPRPGHADLSGCLKYAHKDARNILERSSARETTSRVAVGALCKRLLAEFGFVIFSHILRIGDVVAQELPKSFDELQKKTANSDVRCADAAAAEKMRGRIREAKERGDTIGGVVEIIAVGAPIGLGSCMSADAKLDAAIAQAVMSIQAVKGVEIGMGFAAAAVCGSNVHDAISYSPERGFYRTTNNAGGIEGGMSNGEPIIVRAAFKPIPTMMTPKASVDLITKEPFEASKERSDVCVVPAAGVVAEAAIAFVLARAFLEKFGGDSLDEIKRNHHSYIHYLKNY